MQVGGTAPFTYQWFKNDLFLIAADSGSLSLTNVQPGDAGSYSVIVSSAFGSVTNHFSLSVSFVKIHSYAGLTIEGIPGRRYAIEYLNAWESTSDWHALTNVVLPTNPYTWIDYQTPSVARRFYRVSELPP